MHARFEAERKDAAGALREAHQALATERADAQQANERSRRTADMVREATVALTRCLDRETVATTLLEHLRGLVPVDRASVMVLEESSTLSVRAVFDGERVRLRLPDERPEISADEHPVLRRMLATGTAVVIADTRQLPDWSPAFGFADEASWLAVPLFTRGGVTGALALAKKEVDFFDDEHLRLAETLASQASVAVENAILFEQAQGASARLQDLSRRLVEVQEDERRAVARELHDEAGQALVSLRLGLQRLEREARGGGDVAGHVTELKQTIDTVIDNLHNVTVALRPPSLDVLGLDAALGQYLGSIERKSRLVVRYKTRGLASTRLGSAIETAFYRIVQEAVTNVIRHARATRVDVLVARDDAGLLVVVEDDGVGFGTAASGGAERLGLVGMRERVQALGGTLTIESAPGSGTTVAAEVRL